MSKKFPEMLVRWSTFEKTFHEIMRPVKNLNNRSLFVDPALWELTVRKLDQAVAAATRRDYLLTDTSKRTIDEVWDLYESKIR